MIKGALTVVIGLILAYGGYKIVHALEPEQPKGAVVFAGPWPNIGWIKSGFGYLLLLVGLILAMVFGPFFFIAAR